jgi:hypothetical protein
MNIVDICICFSEGRFQEIYPYFSDDIKWEVIEDTKLEGKDSVIQRCEQIEKYFSSIQTKFVTLNVIANDLKVSINGTAEFIKDSQLVSFISACDIYEFDENHKIKNITSYCISKDLSK